MSDISGSHIVARVDVVAPPEWEHATFDTGFTIHLYVQKRELIQMFISRVRRLLLTFQVTGQPRFKERPDMAQHFHDRQVEDRCPEVGLVVKGT
jgi:hypothetical protein